MTANEILNKYEGNLVMDNEPNLAEMLFEVIKYLAYKESGGDADSDLTVKQYQNDKLWKDIMDISRPAPVEVSEDCDVVRLIELREILEKYKIL